MKFDHFVLGMRWIRWLCGLYCLLCSFAFGMHAWAGVFCSQLLGLDTHKLQVLEYDVSELQVSFDHCEHNFLHISSSCPLLHLHAPCDS
jgi:hypothetical protein